MWLNLKSFNKKPAQPVEKKDEYLKEVLRQWGFTDPKFRSFGTGLINNTWKVHTEYANFILQRVNVNVFRRPEDIDYNISLINEYLKKYHPEYYFVAPTETLDKKTVVYLEKYGWFRMAPFVENSVTVDVVETADQAREAAFQFGSFTRKLSGLDPGKLRLTIPDFHNLALRFKQFHEAIKNGDEDRRKESKEIIGKLLDRENIVKEYEAKIADPAFKKRITHNDTKISNILFNKEFKGICLIDLDTVMPGYFFSDAGDMMRTYLSPVSEEEKDFSKIEIRKSFFDAIVRGYREAMGDELSEEESGSFVFAGKFMIYMQALRFLTDHLNNDVYYGSKYEGHNFVRAGNQLTLLEKMEELDK